MSQDQTHPAAGPPEIPERTLSARELSALIGYSKREILCWATDEDCPHSMTVRRGQPSPSFNADEVRRWRASRGQPVTGKRFVPPDSPVRAPADPIGAAAAPLFTAAAEAQRGNGSIDLAALVQTAGAKLKRILDEAEKIGDDPNAQARIAQAFKAASSELRLLIVAQFDDEKRRGEWIGRDVAARMLASEAEAFTQDLAGMASDVPVAIAGAIEELIDPAHRDRVVRLIGEKIRDSCDRVRVRRAESIRRAASIPTIAPASKAGNSAA
ncbi:MAG: hypothetical protein AMXMBFR58_29560 [Phycisphaerae bacterium]